MPAYKVLVYEIDGVEQEEQSEINLSAPNVTIDNNDFTSITEVNSALTNAKGKRKSQVILHTSFSGSPKIYEVVFTTAYPNSNYKINITGIDKRSWSYSNKASTGFTLETNANQALTGEVSWETVATGE